jgi:hypothetical protein
MTVEDPDGTVDRAHDRLAVVWNANDQTETVAAPALAGKSLKLHPFQAHSDDPLVRTSSFATATGAFTVPERTAAVFWSYRSAAGQIRLLIADIDALQASGELSGGQANSLRAKLRAALRQAERGNDNAAENQVGAFLNEVRALERSGRLTAEQAAALSANASLVIEELNR